LNKLNVDKLTQDKIEEIDTEMSTQLTGFVETLATGIKLIFQYVTQYNVVNTFDHMSPIIERFFSETISQVVLKHNIGFLKELQTNLGNKSLTTPSSYQKIEDQLKPVIVGFMNELGYTDKSIQTFANTIFKNVKTTFSSTETLSIWLVDASPKNTTTRLMVLTRQHIMLKMGNKKDANFDEEEFNDLYSVIILDTVLGTKQLDLSAAQHRVLNEVNINPENPMENAIIEEYLKNVERHTSKIKDTELHKKIEQRLLGKASEKYKEETVNEVLNIARVLSPAILDKYHNNTLDVARDMVDRLKRVIKSRSKDTTIPDEWFNTMRNCVVCFLLLYSVPHMSDMASVLSKCRSVKCRSSDGSNVESDGSGVELDGADAKSVRSDGESDGLGSESGGSDGESETRELPQPGVPIRDVKAYVLEGKGNDKLWIEYHNDYRRITNRGHSNYYSLAQETKTKQRWYDKAHEVGRIDHNSFFQKQ
jgi:hypothetical protein